jgi:hypothetical protein
MAWKIGLLSKSAGGSFGVFEFILPTPIAMLVDQPPRPGEVDLQGFPRVDIRAILAQSKQPRPMQIEGRPGHTIPFNAWLTRAYLNFEVKDAP